MHYWTQLTEAPCFPSIVILLCPCSHTKNTPSRGRKQELQTEPIASILAHFLAFLLYQDCSFLLKILLPIPGWQRETWEKEQGPRQSIWVEQSLRLVTNTRSPRVRRIQGEEKATGHGLLVLSPTSSPHFFLGIPIPHPRLGYAEITETMILWERFCKGKRGGHMKVRRQLEGLGLLLPPWEFCGLNAGHQIW